MELLLGNTEGALKSKNVCTKQQRIAELARLMADASFTSLAYYIDLEWMHEAYRRTRKDGAAGVDGVTRPRSTRRNWRIIFRACLIGSSRAAILLQR